MIDSTNWTVPERDAFIELCEDARERETFPDILHPYYETAVKQALAIEFFGEDLQVVANPDGTVNVLIP